MAPTLVLERFPQTDEELHDFVWTIWGVNIPQVAICPDHSAPFDAFKEAYFARTPVSVWKASRGYGGKSMLLATLCNTEAVCLAAQVTVLGGSAAQSISINENAQSEWNNDLSPSGMLESATIYRTVLSNTAWIRSLTASQRSVRGPHPQRLRLDEIDEMELPILEAAQGQPMPKMRNGHYVETQTVMSSTHQYPDKTMTEILKRGAEKGWPIHHWCYRESMGTPEAPGWLRRETVERKKAEIPSHMWDTEYELQEPSVEGRVFLVELVDVMFDPNEARKAGKLHEEIIIEIPLSEKTGATYVTGVDWAKSKDWTIISTWRTDGPVWKRVAWERVGRISWPFIVDKVNKRLQKYGGVLVHDSTGIGTVIADYLHWDERLTKDFTMVGAARVDLFNDLIAAVEAKSFHGPMIDFAYSEFKYVTLADLFTTSGHPPDSFVADALAWHGRQIKRVQVAPVNITRDGGSPNLVSYS